MAGPEKSSFIEDIPLLVSVLLREFVAVFLLLILESRIAGYDLINRALVLFLILITVRFPYMNSYVFIFESTSMSTWKTHSRHGSRSDIPNSAYNSSYFGGIFFIVVLAAHILGAVAAAALRVYFNVQYGTELQMVNGPSLKFGLSTDVATLNKYNSYWAPEERAACFAGKGFNTTQTTWFPLTHADSYCITDTSMQVWYVGEELAYVTLLCVCFVHIWLATGIAKNGNPDAHPNPFATEYWTKLFTLSFILTILNISLTRAFPTAHGSLHNSVFSYYTQLWTPGAEFIDDKHGEMFFRILGGIVGSLLGIAYSNSLVSTQEADSDPNYYKLVWGFSRGSVDGKEVSQDDNSKCNVIVYQNTTSYRANGGDVKPAIRPSADFKLRIPYSLS